MTAKAVTAEGMTAKAVTAEGMTAKTMTTKAVKAATAMKSAAYLYHRAAIGWRGCLESDRSRLRHRPRKRKKAASDYASSQRTSQHGLTSILPDE
ncbi:MAG: hypothetical protein ACM31O_21835 [Bacteroidota bacterium]